MDGWASLQRSCKHPAHVGLQSPLRVVGVESAELTAWGPGSFHVVHRTVTVWRGGYPGGHRSAFGVAGCRRWTTPWPGLAAWRVCCHRTAGVSHLPREMRPARWRILSHCATSPEGELGRGWRWAQRLYHASRERPDTHTGVMRNVCTRLPRETGLHVGCERLIVARGVAALAYESSAWSHPALPEGGAARIQATTGANL